MPKVTKPERLSDEPPLYGFRTPKHLYHVTFRLTDFGVFESWEGYFGPVRRGKLDWSRPTHEGLSRQVYRQVAEAVRMFSEEIRPDEIVFVADIPRYAAGFEKAFTPILRSCGLNLALLREPKLVYRTDEHMERVRRFAEWQARFG